MTGNPTPTRLYLFRHGQTKWALTGQHTGLSDIPLTDVGREQAKALGKAISHIPFAKVLVSPLSRARETAALAGLSNAAVCDDLVEFNYGQYEGLTSKQIGELVPGWTIWTHPCPQGETLEQARRRAQGVIDTACSIGGNVALVAHGHILRILTAAWLNLPTTDGKYFILDTCTVSLLSYEHENPAVKIWNSPVNFGEA